MKANLLFGLCLAFAVLLSACAASFSPRPVAEVPLRTRAQTQVQDGLTVTVAVPTAEEVEAIYGVDLADKGMQAVWVQVRNEEDLPYWFLTSGLDPTYYSASEAAYAFRSAGGTAPFRGEKNDNWEGGVRVPLLVKWPGVIEPGRRSNATISHLDWFPTIAAALGDTDLKEKMLKGPVFGKDNTKVHLDGYNFLPYFKGETKEGPRKEFFYFSDDGSLMNLRYGRFKVVFAEQRAHGFSVWENPLTPLRFPKLEDLYQDPFERADQEAIGYGQWRAERMFALAPAQAIVAQFLATFKEYPPRQKPGSFSIDQVLETLQTGGTGTN